MYSSSDSPDTLFRRIGPADRFQQSQGHCGWGRAALRLQGAFSPTISLDWSLVELSQAAMVFFLHILVEAHVCNHVSLISISLPLCVLARSSGDSFLFLDLHSVPSCRRPSWLQKALALRMTTLFVVVRDSRLQASSAAACLSDSFALMLKMWR